MALSADEVYLGQGGILYAFWRGSAVPRQVQQLDIPEISGLSAVSADELVAVSPNERVLYHLKRATAE